MRRQTAVTVEGEVQIASTTNEGRGQFSSLRLGACVQSPRRWMAVETREGGAGREGEGRRRGGAGGGEQRRGRSGRVGSECVAWLTTAVTFEARERR